MSKSLDPIFLTTEYLKDNPNILNNFTNYLILKDDDILNELEYNILSKYISNTKYSISLNNLYLGILYLKKPNITMEVMRITKDLDIDHFSILLSSLTKIDKNIIIDYLITYINCGHNVYETREYKNFKKYYQKLSIILIELRLSELPERLIEVLNYSQFSILTTFFFITASYNLPFNQLNTESKSLLSYIGSNPKYYNYLDSNYVCYETNGGLYMATLNFSNLKTVLLLNNVLLVFRTIIPFNESAIEISLTNNLLGKHFILPIINKSYPKQPLELCISRTVELLSSMPYKESILQVIEYYVSDNGFKVINDFCRGNFIDPIDEEDEGSIKDYVLVLNNIIYTVGKKIIGCHSGNIMLYRGSNIQLSKIYTPITVGSIINSSKNQFVSFSSNYNIANNFALGLGGIIFVLTLDLATQKYVLPIVLKDMLPTIENEWLFPLNTSFIVSDTPYISGGVYHIPINIYSQDKLVEITPFTVDQLTDQINNIDTLSF
jgi:hypothetical protein